MIDSTQIEMLTDIVGAQARTLGDSVALECEGRRTTFVELHDRVQQVARALTAYGVKPGDRVALLNWNDDSWFPLDFGTAAIGACMVPINARLSPFEVGGIIEDAAPRLLFVGDALIGCADQALASIGSALEPVVIGTAPGRATLDAWLAEWDRGEPAERYVPRAEDDVLQLYTSGTTGKPKGVVLTNANYAAFLRAVNGIDGFSYDTGQTVMMVMPLFHVAGTNVSFAALAQGCRIYIVRDLEAERAVAIMQEERVAHAFLAPAIILMLLNSNAMKQASFPELRAIAYGASPISEDVLRRAQAAFGCDFVQFYGMTESSGSGTSLSPADHQDAALLRSCGRPWPGMEVAILDPDGTVLPPHAIGEIAIRGPLVMRGYWQRPEATADTIRDGWLLTGDAGYVDEAGYFYVHDRIKDMIVSGGENVYPAEVENAILGCPGVADVAVIGIPDERWGESVMALVVCGDTTPEAADVIAFARSRIAAYKAPKRVEFVEALPRNASGKVLRRELRARYWEGRDRAVG